MPLPQTTRAILGALFVLLTIILPGSGCTGTEATGAGGSSGGGTGGAASTSTSSGSGAAGVPCGDEVCVYCSQSQCFTTCNSPKKCSVSASLAHCVSDINGPCKEPTCDGDLGCFACDGPEDCAPGELCFFDAPITYCSATPGTSYDQLVCRTDDECAVFQKKCLQAWPTSGFNPSFTIPTIKTCQGL